MADGCTQKAFRRFLVALCCGDTQLADDIAQESYLKAYLALDTLKDSDKIRGWLYRIGYNTFLSHRRSERPTADYDEARTLAAPDASDGAFRYQELYAALNRLPSRERTAILLFYIEGYQTKEIAEIVEASEEAVRQQLSRGRNHLKQYMTDGR
ncbi:MAG: RNA polymerase sigma factor [Muribaculaceae bacterium]|nr:RNA polymerase sigma factor [Muribaculaceae bacterium]MDE6134182.1 RNA polymerase sigma factor [Muribaculaceae bacterium]